MTFGAETLAKKGGMKISIPFTGGCLLLALGLAGTVHASTPQTTEIIQSILKWRDLREARQLLDDRDTARFKAGAAEALLGEAAAVGFPGIRAMRHLQMIRAEGRAQRLAIQQEHVRAVNERTKALQAEVEIGARPKLVLELARFEQLQAEVDLAREEGRLPVYPEKEWRK
jgi:hypothetical protein